MKDFKRGAYVEKVYYDVNFYSHEDGGYGFPCDGYGNPLFDQMTETAQENYKRCIKLGAEHFPYGFEKVERHVSRWRENNSGICYCGKRIELYDEYLGGCECPHCGQWWNLSGQPMNDPDTWRDGPDWGDEEEDY